MARLIFAALLACLALAGCTADPPPAPTTTVTLTAATALRDASIVYTCGSATGVGVCGPEREPSSGGWTRTVTVPVGTVVRVQVTPSTTGPFAFARCSIAIGRLTLDDGEQQCEAEAR